MELIVSQTRGLTLADKIMETIRKDSRYGNKNCYIYPETTNEAICRSDQLFKKPMAPNTYRLAIQLRDKSVCYFTVHAINEKYVQKMAREYVRDFMHVIGFEQVIWKVEGFETIHFENLKINMKNKIQTFFAEVKQQVDDFFWGDDLD